MMPALAVVFAALCFATVGTADALADVDVSKLSIGAARLLLGGAVLALVAYSASRRRDIPAAPPQPTLPATPRVARRVPSWIIVGFGALGMFGFQPTFLTGAEANGVAVGTVVAIGSAPIITGVLDAVIRRRRPSLRWGIATAIALVGVLLVSGVLSAEGSATAHPGGILSSLGAGACYAVYTIASKMLLDRGWIVTMTVGATFGVAAALSIPILVMTDTAWLLTANGIVLTLWLALIATVLAYLVFGWGLRRLNPATVTSLGLAEPLGAALLGVLLLHERLSLPSGIGLALIVLGLVLLSLPTRRRPQNAVIPL